MDSITQDTVKGTLERVRARFITKSIYLSDEEISLKFAFGVDKGVPHGVYYHREVMI